MNQVNQRDTSPPFLNDKTMLLGGLPVEVFEMILNNISNETDLMTLRLVNSEWNSSTVRVLQRRIFQQATSWDPTITHIDDPRCPKFPKLSLVTSSKKWTCENILSVGYFPKGFTKFERGINPFPTNCVSLWRDFKDANKNGRTLSVSRLLQQNGHNLKLLEINGVALSPYEIHKVLQFLPNLKVLFLQGIAFDYKEMNKNSKGPSSENPLVVSIPPNLTHLTFRHCCFTIPNWLLKQFVYQLEHLETTDGDFLLPFTPDDLSPADGSLASKPFQCLKELKVLSASRDILQLSRSSLTIPLERLSLIWPDKKISLKDLMQFTEKFSNNLEEFCLWVDENRLPKESDDQSDSPLPFPRLSRFCINGMQDRTTARLIKEQFLRRFPNLKTLQLAKWYSGLATRKERECAAQQYIGREGLLNICPKLKTIQVDYSYPEFDFQDGKQGECHTFTRDSLNNSGEN